MPLKVGLRQPPVGRILSIDSEGSPGSPPRTADLRSGPPVAHWTPLEAFLATTLILGVAIAVAFLVVPATVRPSGGPALPTTLLIMQATIIVATVFVAGRYGQARTAALSLSPPRAGWKSYGLGVAAFLVVLLALNTVLILILGHDPLADLRPMVAVIRGDGWLWTLLAFGLGAPLAEELLFRAFLLPALARGSLGFAGASIVSTLMWTSLHIGASALGLAEIFLIGLLLSWLLQRTGSVRVPLLCHILNNSVLVLAVRFLPLPL